MGSWSELPALLDRLQYESDDYINQLQVWRRANSSIPPYAKGSLGGSSDGPRVVAVRSAYPDSPDACLYTLEMFVWGKHAAVQGSGITNWACLTIPLRMPPLPLKRQPCSIPLSYLCASARCLLQVECRQWYDALLNRTYNSLLNAGDGQEMWPQAGPIILDEEGGKW